MPKRTKVEKADIAVAETAAPLRHTPPVKALGFMSELADQPPLFALCAAVLAFGVTSGRPRIARAGARMLAAEALATMLKSAVKHRIDRTRPRVAAEGGRYKMERGHSHDSAVNSFPSGHTAGAVAVARALAREYPDARLPGYAAAAAVAVIQIPRCQHYPSDLAGGALIGLAAEAAVDWAGSPLIHAATGAGRR